METYWKKYESIIQLQKHKICLSEDARLIIMAYCIVKCENPDKLFEIFKVIINFIDFEVYEDAAPISTMETAFQLIILMYSDICRQSNKKSLKSHNELSIDRIHFNDMKVFMSDRQS